MSQPLEGDELANLKGVTTAISYASCSHSLKPCAVVKRKTNKGQKAYEVGWKNKGFGISRTEIFSLLHSHTKLWSSLIIDSRKILRVYGLGIKILCLGFRI